MFFPPNSNDPNDWLNYHEAERVRREVDRMHMTQPTTHRTVYVDSGPSAFQIAAANKFVEKHPMFACFYSGVMMLFGIALFGFLIVYFAYMFVPKETLESYHLSWVTDTCSGFNESLKNLFAPDLTNPSIEAPSYPIHQEQFAVPDYSETLSQYY